MFLGDTSFGESYQRHREQKGEENILKTRGYGHCLKNMADLLNNADFVLANLETPITDIAVSPFTGQKLYIHQADLVNTPAQLSAHGIQAISLANNHSFDYGAGGLVETFGALKAHGLTYIGAGENGMEAAKPLLLEVNGAENSLAIAIFAAFDASERFKEQIRGEPGGAALQFLDVNQIGGLIKELKMAYPSLLTVAFPHWGSNYKWRTPRQQRVAKSLLDAGIDLIIGHGAHMIQEIEYEAARWIVYCIGNFAFNSPGRYQKYSAPPFSCIANLVVRPEEADWEVCLRLYPLVSDNQRTDYQSRLTTRAESELVRELLCSRNQSSSLSLFQDSIGYYLELPVNLSRDVLETD
jgi:poly-gamma-glutamate capsule biosynthesis protein CapA/YwtB (metallophosphatase superfamily)